MKISYIAPNMHINQIYAIKGLLEEGSKVFFYSQTISPKKDYSYYKPIHFGYNLLSEAVSRMIYPKNELKRLKFLLKFGFPNIKLFKDLKKNVPDLLIMRNHSLYTMSTYIYTRFFLRKNCCVLYTQLPINHKNRKMKIKKLITFFFPKTEITPFYGKGNITYKNKNNVHYVPLVIEPQKKSTKKIQSKNVRILCVAQFQERKKIYELVKVFEKILIKYKDIQLDIIGTVNSKKDKSYYNKVMKYVKENKLSNKISIRTNIPHQKLLKEYEKADIFVLPSVNEPASFSPLEAMSYGLPAIISSDNGVKEYIEKVDNFLIYDSTDIDDLYRAIEKLVNNKKLRTKMGQKAYKMIIENHHPKVYLKNIEKIYQRLKDQ